MTKNRKTTKLTMLPKSETVKKTSLLARDIRTLIEQARHHVANSVNVGLVALYWQIGRRIQQDVLKGKRAGYGEQIISTLSQQLIKEYGRGYSKPNLSRMTALYEYFPNPKIVSTLSKQLTWSHFVEILPLKDSPEKYWKKSYMRLLNWLVNDSSRFSKQSILVPVREKNIVRVIMKKKRWR